MRSRVRRLSAGAVSTGAVAVLVTVAVVSGALLRAPHDVRREGARVTGTRSAGATALVVLTAWDRRRATAWAAGDTAALEALYVAGSRTGARDVRALAHWHRRGMRVVGLHQQVVASEVLARSPGRYVVRVTERTVGAVAVGGPHRIGLPDSAWRTHRIALRRAGGVWRVVEARAQPAR